MRRSFALALACLLSLTFLVVPARRAASQEPPLRLRLLEQTPAWNDPDHPTMVVRFRAENTGTQTYDDLSVGVTLWSPALSRTAFEEAMNGDVPGAAVLLGQTLPRDGALAPGDSREFAITIALPLAQLSSTQSLVYPLTIDLRSHFESLAAIRTPVIYLVRTPLLPVGFSWTFVLHTPLAMRPDGVFTSPSFESSISPGGRLSAEIAALAWLADEGAPVDVVVSPLLLLQLRQMQDGYGVVDGGQVRTVAPGNGGSASAAGALARLRTIAHAPNVELSALPYAEPFLPALTSGGLARDLGVQVQSGRELVSTLLGRVPSTTVFRPPQSALDEASLDELPAQGVSTLLLDPTTVRRAGDAQGFAPPPVVSLAAQNATLTGIVGDPAVQTMLGNEVVDDDPALGARWVLGDLAEIWLQQPGEARGLAMIVGESLGAPGALYRPLATAVAGAPWLAKRTAAGLLEDGGVHVPGAVSQVIDSPSAFSSAYVTSIKRARRFVATYRTMLVRPSGQPPHLEQLLLLAESQRFVGDERSGMAFVGRVQQATTSMFAAVRPQPAQSITLTSSSIRNVPLLVSNDAAVPLRATIRLWSPHLVSPVERTRVFPPDSTTTVSVDLELKTRGRFEVNVDTFAPTGRRIGHDTLVVRSTAYNRVALMITIGAAALAMLVWARRFVPRRTR
jgi:Glycosyl hydrolase family 57